MYEANVDDVGYRLVAIYTPVREDGIEGQPVSASTESIAVGNSKCHIICHCFFPKLLYMIFLNSILIRSPKILSRGEGKINKNILSK